MNSVNNSIEGNINSVDVIQDQIDDIILELIKERKKKKITQMELSKATGIPQATISRLESFNSIPTLQVLIKLSNALNLYILLRQMGASE